MDWCLSVRVLAQNSLITGSISRGGNHNILCWWDLIKPKQLSSVSVCRVPDFLVLVIVFFFFFFTLKRVFLFFLTSNTIRPISIYCLLLSRCSLLRLDWKNILLLNLWFIFYLSYLSIYLYLMMKVWNSGNTKNTNNGFSSEYFVIYLQNNFFNVEQKLKKFF